MALRQIDDAGRAGGARSVAVLALVALLAGCAGSLQDTGLVPTSGVRSADTGRTPAYPAVGVTPRPGAPAFTADEQARTRRDLEAAREGNRAAAVTPHTQPLPPRPPTP